MTFRTSTIPLAATGQFSPLFLDYIHDAEKLRPFYTFRPDASAFAAAIEKLNGQTFDRVALVDVLREQEAEELQRNPALAERISALLQGNTFTVCTGHQLCLFTGPLYFIYKIITTIRLAETLKEKYPAQDFVPVYWMASEDHDFEEINHAHLFGKTLRWTYDAKGPAGKLPTATLLPLLDELKTVLGESPSAQEFFAMIAAAYDGQATLAEATRRLVHALFGKYNLLVLDADDVRLKKRFVPFMRNELLQPENEKLVLAQSAALEKAGYSAQVNPRAINLFYMREGLRERIEKENGAYRVLNTELRFSEQELLAELDAHPERFSPNVVLRPVYQQVILPNLAYVGGPGELAYWLQYKTMFDALNVLLPVLVPRSFALIADKPSQDRLQKLGVALSELFGDIEALLKTYVQRTSGSTLDLSPQKEQLKALFAEVRTKAAAIDATLEKATDAELQKQLNALEGLESKFVRAEKQKQETALNQLRKLKEKFFPEGALQERYDNFLPYALKHSGFIDALHDSLAAFGNELLVLEEA